MLWSNHHAVNFSHENHLYCFDQIPSCQFFTWESLIMLWSNLSCQFFTWESLIMFWSKSQAVNFSHENHLLCFDKIPMLSIFHIRTTCFALIKSLAVTFLHENHLLCFDQIPSCQFFTWESLIMLWSNPQL